MRGDGRRASVTVGRAQDLPGTGTPWYPPAHGDGLSKEPGKCWPSGRWCAGGAVGRRGGIAPTGRAQGGVRSRGDGPGRRVSVSSVARPRFRAQAEGLGGVDGGGVAGCGAANYSETAARVPPRRGNRCGRLPWTGVGGGGGSGVDGKPVAGSGVTSEGTATCSARRRFSRRWPAAMSRANRRAAAPAADQHQNIGARAAANGGEGWRG